MVWWGETQAGTAKGKNRVMIALQNNGSNSNRGLHSSEEMLWRWELKWNFYNLITVILLLDDVTNIKCCWVLLRRCTGLHLIEGTRKLSEDSTFSSFLMRSSYWNSNIFWTYQFPQLHSSLHFSAATALPSTHWPHWRRMSMRCQQCEEWVRTAFPFICR